MQSPKKHIDCTIKEYWCIIAKLIKFVLNPQEYNFAKLSNRYYTVYCEIFEAQNFRGSVI